MTTAPADKLLGRLDSLPTLPAIAVRVLEMSLSENTSTQEMVDILSKDPALATKILKVVNSAAFALRNQVSSLPYAVTILGLQRIRTLVLSLSILKTLARFGEAGELDKMGFWRYSVASAVAAKSLAQATGKVNPEEAYIAGLIHDLGILLFDTIIPQKYNVALRKIKNLGADSILDLEKEIASISHVEIGAKLAERWKLPQSLKMAIRFHHTPEECLEFCDPSTYRLVAVTAAADFLAWSAGYALFDTVQPPVPGISVIDLISSLDLAEQYQTIHDEVKKGSEIFNYNDSQSDRWEQALLRANAELGRISAQLELANRGLTSLNTALLNAQHRLGERNPIESLLAEVVGTLGYDRSLLLEKQEQNNLRVVKVMSTDGSGTELENKVVTLDLKQINLTRSGLLLKQNKGTATKNHLLHAFHAKEMVLVPIYEGNAMRYILAADRTGSGQEVTENAVAILSQLTIQAGLLLENYRLYQTVQDMAITDPLTGVCNRRRLMEVVSEEVDRAIRTKRPLSVAIVDIDYFKKINDKLGHLVGDQVLKKVAELLRNSIRQGDCVGRYGGEEFLIVLPGADREKAIKATERMRKAIERLSNESRELLHDISLTASFGVAELTLEHESFEGLLGRADSSLYVAKESGRNRVCIAAQQVPKKSEE